MEEEDFGYTRRDDKVLRQVLREPNGENRGAAATGEQEERVTAPRRKALNANGEFIPAAGVAKGSESGTSPEAGSEPVDKRPLSKAPVARDTPNIPNVVEYHLKVKPRGTEKKSSVSRNISQSPEEMKKETPTIPSNQERKNLPAKFSKLTIDNNVFDGSNDLPQTFQVKYLGSHDARGLWGIKHTRKPVDNMVASARTLPTGTILPFIRLIVSEDGVALIPFGKRGLDGGVSRMYPIETISYGVQDLVYTRVFSMIVVRETGNVRGVSPFECHGFVCESKHCARQLTYALASAFQIYSQNVKAQGRTEETATNIKKRFAIDLRSPEEIEADLAMDSEA